jgi:hypothetical protein
MTRYECIDYVLGNYFTGANELSEQEGIKALREHLAANAEFAAGLRKDVQQALADESYSWREALAEHDVLTIEDEEEARQYGRKLLGAVLDLT